MCFDTIPLTYVWAFGFVGFILFEIVAEGMGRSTHRFEAFLVVKYPVLGTNFCLCLQVAAEFGSCGLCPPGQDRMLLQVMPKITNPLKGVFGHAEWLILKKPCDDLANSTLCQNQNIHSACCFCHHPMHLFPNIQYLPYSNVAMENPAFTDGFPIQIPVKLGFSSSFITAGYISTYFNIYISCDWWFGTFLVFPYIVNIYIIIPTDFHIFRGIGQSPTSLQGQLLGAVPGDEARVFIPTWVPRPALRQHEIRQRHPLLRRGRLQPRALVFHKDGTTQSEPVGITGGFKH